ncbi:MAG: aminopeptidase P family protein [Byssovorax sp.]
MDLLEKAPAPGPEAAEAPAAEKPNPDPPPKALLDFMVQGWRPASAELPGPIDGHEAFYHRRRSLSALFPGDYLIIPTGSEKVRSNDTHYRFRPSSDFYYLVGSHEPDGVLVLVPDGAGGHRDTLFVDHNPGRADATFFTDRQKGELWVGRGARLGVPESQARFAVHEAKPLGELGALFDALTVEGAKPFRLMRGFSAAADCALPAQSERDKQLATALGEMRLRKDAQEVRELEGAIASTLRGFEDVIRALPKARSEREVEGIFGLRARVEGNDVGYGTIAASGAHACTLHYTKNRGDLRAGSLLLLDAGVEGDSLYTADITRTLPIGGRFSPEQREIYDLVLAAHDAAMTEVKPGKDFLDPNKAAMKVLAEGLERLGILTVPAAAALADDQQLYKRYSLHNISHMLGLDVHDCAEARQEAYKYGKLVAGMVLTIEPGLYFQEDDLTVPERYRGIGVRIEDDVLVTDDGCRNLSAAFPVRADDVEAWMARLAAG